MQAYRSRTAAERALSDIVRDSSTNRNGGVEWLLFCHLGHLQVPAEASGGRFQIRVRYGDSGRYQEQYSEKEMTECGSNPVNRNVRQQGSFVKIRDLVNAAHLNGAIGVCTEWDRERCRWYVRVSHDEVKAVQNENLDALDQIIAYYDSMLIFRWSDELPPYLTLAIRKLGMMDKTVAEATVKIPFRPGVPGVAEQTMLFFDKKREATGSKGFQLPSIGGRKMALPSMPSFGKKPAPDVPKFDHKLAGQLGVAVEMRRFSYAEFMNHMMCECMIAEMIGSLDMLAAPVVVLVHQPTTQMSSPVAAALARAQAGREQQWSASQPSQSQGSQSHQPSRPAPTPDKPANQQPTGRPIGRSSSSAEPWLPPTVSGVPISGSAAGSSHLGTPSGADNIAMGQPVPGDGWSWGGRRVNQEQEEPKKTR